MKKRRGQIGKNRPHNALVKSKRNLPKIYLSESHELKPEIYMPDPGARHSGSRFKWLISTCIAAIVGVAAIGMAMYASMDMEEGEGVLNTLQKASIDGMRPVEQTKLANSTLRVATRKTDRLTVTSYGLSTEYTIHDRIAQKRGNREFIVVKPYAKIVATLSSARPKNTKGIPNFNPFKLYANTTPLANSRNGSRLARRPKNILVKVVSLTPNMISNQDGQTLSISEIHKIVRDDGRLFNQSNLEANASGDQPIIAEKAVEEKLPPRTTVIEKSVDDDDALPEEREFHQVKVKRGDSLMVLIREAGANSSDATAIAKAMGTIVPGSQIQAGQVLKFILVPSSQDKGKMEPLSISLFSGLTHKATVVKSGEGEYAEYVASEKPVELTAKGPKKSVSRRSNVYLSLYHAALAQNIPHDKILKILRVHSYSVDFKRRVQSGDTFEAFFDDEQDATPTKRKRYGTLLFTSTTIGGDTKSFYRFRTPDGSVDYYDENGSSSKQFLMRKPVRGARFTSGYGFRFHPVLKKRKMHSGADWAAPTGTPILAAGNGHIEFVGVKGGYGNYVSIRHANGYKTAYAHMHRFARGVKKGLKVRQGQVIGYVGSTGRSTGPHLHYEVLVNNKRVDPMRIDVPKGRELKGRMLAAFQKERERINRLMRQPAVKTRVAKVEGQS